MSGKLEGIGAVFKRKNDFTEISELISGGPGLEGNSRSWDEGERGPR
jgi:carboxyl-terminal processing protease